MTDHHFYNKYTIESAHLQHIACDEYKSVTWRSPSNIALVKYWGKYGNQLPRNASVSFTLSKSYTETTVAYKSKNSRGISIEYFFENKHNPEFEKKLANYLRELLPVLPYLDTLHLTIHSHNTFPHSTGIASSASGISALALCLCSIEHEELNLLTDDFELRRKASYLSRLGSGSACRSVYGGTVLWGHVNDVNGSFNEIAIPINDKVNSIFKTYYDSILVADSSPKEVPSSAGHNLMNHHRFANTRFLQASDNMSAMLNVLQQGNVQQFGEIVENEALTLHALMLSAQPGYILLHPNTLSLIKKLKALRQHSKIDFCYTLDAGPNIHLLYPEASRVEMLQYITNELVQHCENGLWIDDMVGSGPMQV